MRNEQEYIDEINNLWFCNAHSNPLESLSAGLGSRLLCLVERGIEFHPCSSRLWFIRGEVLQLLAGRTGDNMDCDAVRECYSKAIEFNKLNYMPYESLAYLEDIYYLNYTNAERLFKAAITLGAGLESYLGLARILAQLKRKNEGFEILDEAKQKFHINKNYIDEIDNLIIEISEGIWDN